ncbi:MAG: tRNA pseudouridine(38-40) synthase TruA [Pseudomonadota bacterium]
MPRYRLTWEYDGGPFVGWQRQANGPSVQEALETAIEAFTGERVAVAGAGRTDAGVHALGQVAHADLRRDDAADTVRDALNFHLKPAPVAVVGAQRVADDFHARFDAVERRYLYRIVKRRAPLTYERGRAWRVSPPFDANAMHEAAQALVGKHDFTTFRAAECQARSPVKTLTAIEVARTGDVVDVRVRAPSFLHRQVRSIVGTLQRVGAGAWTKDDVARALAARDRATCGPVAPAEGLYLAAVIYPGD